MKTGEHYQCQCGAEIEVIRPCTCQTADMQQLTCVCGMPLKAVQGAQR